jgi:hypothetical protein
MRYEYLSDQVDIVKIKPGMNAQISLDAYE